MEIVPIKIKNEKNHPSVNPILPQHEFSMLIVAPKGAGKTNFICNLLLNKNFYFGYFNQVWVCSPSVDNDDKWGVVKETKHVLCENKHLQKILSGIKKPTPDKLPQIVSNGKQDPQKKYDGKIPEADFFSNMKEVPSRIAMQNKIISNLKMKGVKHPKFAADRILVILDDQAGLFKNGTGPMVNYVIKHRHSNTSLIIVTQAYKEIPKTIRTNCNSIILFNIPNLSELKVIYEENPEQMDFDTWKKCYQYCTEEQYSFMYINNKFPQKETVHRKFIEKVHFKNNNSESAITDTSEL